MRYFVMVILLASVAGCLTEADRREWEDAKRDLRGDNMEMGSGDNALRSSALKPMR